MLVIVAPAAKFHPAIGATVVIPVQFINICGKSIASVVWVIIPDKGVKSVSKVQLLNIFEQFVTDGNTGIPVKLVRLVQVENI
jgi:hypothetical protein